MNSVSSKNRIRKKGETNQEEKELINHIQNKSGNYGTKATGS